MRHGAQKFEYAFFKKGLKALWELLEGHRKRLWEFLGWAAVSTFLSLYQVYVAKNIIDLAKASEKTSIINHEVTFLLLFVLSIIIFNEFLKKIIMDIRFLKYRENLMASWPQTAFERLLFLPISFHLGENTGKKVSKISKGCVNSGNILNHIYNGLPNIIYLFMNTAMVFWMDWRLGLIFFLPLPIAIWVLWRGYQKSAVVWRDVEIAKEEANGIFCESIICINTVKINVQEGEESQRFSDVLSRRKELTIKANKIIYWHGFFASVIIYSCYLVAFGASYYLSVYGVVTLGIMFYIFSTTRTMYKGIWFVINAFQGILINLISVIRMKDLMDQKSNIEYPPGALLPRDAEGKINCCNIDFFYEERGRKIFSDFNLEIPKGNTLAVVGSTGTGKTSLINLFLRLYDVNGGDIYIDNKNIKSFHPKFRKLFAVVPQDIDIFNKDILHNVRYGCNHVSERDVEKALRVSNFSSALGSKDFPDGIYTKIGEGGKDLSGGERQRIAIARAYLALTMGGAKFLILDEATSNLDANTEKDVREVINNIKKEMDFTTIIITHRLSMVKYADEIIFLDNGKIAERGTHEELINKKGKYAEFVKNQNLSKEIG
ncbi:hypothetical protein A2331_06535 [Candidatus Falkowbacteria bacterium RIFOXYB2_FULL_34_18]|uniref:ABC transporter domain-containing protein n=1 Tax=Candidatus Falkowbacteria bacterium RIFOXYD2_FULL_34_120 TaxID=1798007 RepID=A0A1F5TR37_9BACT|nr:MAG: hypothetical protein A2331_06535 [Candidatus Falkowbacteria bacterium RIFOXYB2_FULL_34_18]OGF36639.1 MAG: hypothetical protein A2466_03455 [Candidatus Falkowbacteria bacterium RIFOXYC2_FULL_34_220]OGF39292.1 MAG: hypothetical protein A2515_01920 [Candidatus Falkowbacteria bacterium RIFOXYD12_FULL_34_57]OGF41430.1 MAG: hypothetical protein A2531_00085 [Candidatus Falkowbacteria bacterium RIFOXYD2_FULL_34_120]